MDEGEARAERGRKGAVVREIKQAKNWGAACGNLGDSRREKLEQKRRQEIRGIEEL